MKEQPTHLSVIVRKEDMAMESDLARLEKENLMLREELAMMKYSSEGPGQEAEGNYEKLMQEVSRLKSAVDKVGSDRFVDPV